MFVSKNRLEHLLRGEHYTSPQIQQQEIDRVFRPSWHLVGTRSEVANSGDFKTFDLLGTPLLIRNFDGDLHCFLNVCAHRHCEIVSAPCGHSPTLKCQYHGWEYDERGKTGRIPDAGCFRPWDRENAQLRKFRLETCGDLVFVNLTADGPDLRAFLGDPFHELDARFRPPRVVQVDAWDYEFPANWKIHVEINLESYHIPLVHPETFGSFPQEERCWHDLNESWTRFRTQGTGLPNEWLLKHLVGRLGGQITGKYAHTAIHPHVSSLQDDFVAVAQMVLPIAPDRCRSLGWLYTLKGTRRGLYERVIHAGIRKFARKFAKRIIYEDATVFPALQRGLGASPFPGVIGTREERIYLFQADLLRRLTGEARPIDWSHGERDDHGDAATPQAAVVTAKGA